MVLPGSSDQKLNSIEAVAPVLLLLGQRIERGQHSRRQHQRLLFGASGRRSSDAIHVRRCLLRLRPQR